MINLRQAISDSKYFSPDIDAEIDDVIRAGRLISANPGELLISEGSKDERLFLNLSGIVKVFKTSIDGRELILYFAKAGEAINDMWFMNDGFNIASAQSIGPVNCFAIERKKLETLIDHYPDTGLKLLRELSLRVCSIIDLLGDVILVRVNNRLCKLLLDIAEGRRQYEKALSQQDMAGLLGTSREVVSRSLRELRERGIISIIQNRIVILDVNALSELAEGVIY